MGDAAPGVAEPRFQLPAFVPGHSKTGVQKRLIRGPLVLLARWGTTEMTKSISMAQSSSLWDPCDL